MFFAAALAGSVWITSARAAHVVSYGILKKEIYQQTSDTAVAPAAGAAYGFGAFAIPTAPESLVLAMLMPPGGAMPVIMMPTSVGFDYASTSDSRAGLDGTFPNGDYQFTLMSTDFMAPSAATVNLAAGTVPSTTPQVSDYTALQAVDPAKATVINWNSFDPSADAFVLLTVRDDSSEIVFQTGWPGQTTALAGTVRSVTIPANTLTAASTYDASLTFGKITARNTTAIPGSTGAAILARETQFTLKTAGSGEDPDDPEDPDDSPAFLMSSSPINGAQNVSVDATVRFTFGTPMAPMQSISWSANVTAANFSYSWSADGRTLTCTYNGTFPSGTIITWTLDPTGFASATGGELVPFNNSGSFTTGSGQGGTGGPCDNEPGDHGVGVLTIGKNLNYTQTHPNAPVLDADNPAVFMAMVSSPATNPVTQATLQLPNGTTKTLDNLFGRFATFEEFPSQEALDAAYPAGNYTVTMKRGAGSVSMTLNVGSAPPTPQITNLGQPFDAAADFQIQWQPFTGVDPNDALSIEMHQASGTSFHAPDQCIPRPLANTATSIVVPKNFFAAGAGVDGALSFVKTSGFDTNSVRDVFGYASYGKVTQFKLQTSGTTPDTQLRLQGLARQPNGIVTFQVTAKAGAIVTVEGSSDLRTWTPVTAGPAPTGTLNVTDTEAATLPRRVYRAKTF